MAQLLIAKARYVAEKKGLLKADRSGPGPCEVQAYGSFDYQGRK